MKQIFKIIKYILHMLLLAFLVGCSPTIPEPKLFSSDEDKYAYVKEYMRWYIQKQMDDNEIMGLSIALVDDQKIVWQEGFGYEDKAKGIKATPQTRYRAGSITKLFNAMAVMKLSEEGKMNIDKPLKRYLPEFKIKSRFGSTDNITPRNIMTHHSGIPGDWVDGMFATKPLPYTEYVKEITNEYIAYRPNTLLSYSNLAITLLGHSVEKVCGMKYEEYINKILLKPMEMKNTDLKMALHGNHASKSYHEGKEIIEYPLGTIPAGALNTSVEELSHLAMMINAKGMYKNNRVLKSATLVKMFNVQNKNVALDLGKQIGLGYFIDKTLLGDTNTIYSHGGATIGHRAYFTVVPNMKMGVVVMLNSITTDGRIVEEIANTFLTKVWEAKTAQKYEPKNIHITKDSDFEGMYSTIAGRVIIKKKLDGSYIAHTESGDFSLEKDKYNLYKAKYKLFGLISISDKDLESVRFYTEDIEDKHIIVMYKNGKNILAGIKVKRHLLPKIWKSYVGHYNIINNFEMEDWKIDDIEFVIENGYALIHTTYKSGNMSTLTLEPINDTEAIIEGIGRSMRETVYYKDGMLHIQGLKYKK